MSFKVQIDALRRHADALEEESNVWGETIPRQLTYGDIGLTGDAFTIAGYDLQAAYQGVDAQYGTTYIGAVSEALYLAACMLRRAADTYGDTDAVIADTF